MGWQKSWWPRRVWPWCCLTREWVECEAFAGQLSCSQQGILKWCSVVSARVECELSVLPHNTTQFFAWKFLNLPTWCFCGLHYHLQLSRSHRYCVWTWCNNPGYVWNNCLWQKLLMLIFLNPLIVHQWHNTRFNAKCHLSFCSVPFQFQSLAADCLLNLCADVQKPVLIWVAPCKTVEWIPVTVEQNAAP